MGHWILLMALKAKSPGDASKNSKVKLRLSVDTENSPLVLISTIDGMVQIEDMEKINSEDISGMSVIKDKWAIDKYGEKAKKRTGNYHLEKLKRYDITAQKDNLKAMSMLTTHFDIEGGGWVTTYG